MATKARIRLNLKRLYSADGYAVKELLKIASVLASANEEIADDNVSSQPSIDAYASVSSVEVHETRRLASEITQRGASLHELLSEEEGLRNPRQRALAKPVDLLDAEAYVQSATHALQDSIQRTEQAISESNKDEENLEAKIDKRKAELERAEKRLDSLKKVRPQYMDEYEQLQDELQELYDTYIERQRNLHYLEEEMNRYEAEEHRRMEESERALRSMQKRLKDEELKMLRGDFQLNDDGKDTTLEAAPPGRRPGTAASAPKSARGRRHQGWTQKPYTRVQNVSTNGKMKGTLLAGSDEDDEEDEGDIVGANIEDDAEESNARDLNRTRRRNAVGIGQHMEDASIERNVGDAGASGDLLENPDEGGLTDEVEDDGEGDLEAASAHEDDDSGDNDF